MCTVLPYVYIRLVLKMSISGGRRDDELHTSYSGVLREVFIASSPFRIARTISALFSIRVDVASRVPSSPAQTQMTGTTSLRPSPDHGEYGSGPIQCFQFAVKVSETSDACEFLLSFFAITYARAHGFGSFLATRTGPP